jgi:hypothetical protein
MIMVLTVLNVARWAGADAQNPVLTVLHLVSTVLNVPRSLTVLNVPQVLTHTDVLELLGPCLALTVLRVWS